MAGSYHPHPWPSTLQGLPTALRDSSGQQLPSSYCWENYPHGCARRKWGKTKKQLSAFRVRDVILAGSYPSEEPLEAAGSWEGRSPGKMLGVVGRSMAQPWGGGKCAGPDPPPWLTGGSNLGSEEKLSPLPPRASMTAAPGQSPSCTFGG